MPPTIGQVVKRMREEHRPRRLTQREVESASHGKITQSWLASLESDRSKNPRDREKLELLAKILGVTVAQIYEQAGIIDLAFPEGSSPEEQRMLRKFRQLSDDQRLALLEFIERTYHPQQSEDANMSEQKPNESVVRH